MRKGNPNCRRGVPGMAGFLLFAACFFGFPRLCDAADSFRGYAEPVRSLAAHAVEAAGPGDGEEFARRVRLLEAAMHAQGILSLNGIPDLVFERAVREGWKGDVTPSLRRVAGAAPLSVQLWAWLMKEDVLALRLSALARDFQGLTGSVRWFGPALLGCASWLISFLAATTCWFAAWASITLFLRARPSLEADIARLFKGPCRVYLAALAAAFLFLLPLLGGVGLAVAASFWLALSAGYLRRGELVMMTTSIVLLAALLAGGTILHSLRRMTGEGQRGGWMGTEGYFPGAWPEASLLPGGPGERESIAWLVRFSRARAAMFAGTPADAERLWSELIRDGRDLPEVRNNRGISLAQQGRLEEGLADFEEALRKAPEDGPALWNAYNASLRLFDLERARALQPLAWDRISRMSPYGLRPAELGQTEWIASALHVGDIWKSFLGLRGGWVREAGESDVFRLFFRPLSPSASLVFLFAVWVAGGVWKALSLKIWVHRTCRGCGATALILGSRESHELCKLCRIGVGGEGNPAGEPDRRGQAIAMHRFHVGACSVLVPGSGALWSGKELSTLLYGILLSLSLGGVSSSVGGGEGGAIVSELRSSLALGTAALAAALWLAGAAWGVRSFRRMQYELGITAGKG